MAMDMAYAVPGVSSDYCLPAAERTSAYQMSGLAAAESGDVETPNHTMHGVNSAYCLGSLSAQDPAPAGFDTGPDLVHSAYCLPELEANRLRRLHGEEPIPVARAPSAALSDFAFNHAFVPGEDLSPVFSATSNFCMPELAHLVPMSEAAPPQNPRLPLHYARGHDDLPLARRPLAPSPFAHRGLAPTSPPSLPLGHGATSLYSYTA